MTIKDYKFEFSLVNGKHTGDRLYGAFDLLFSICAELSYRDSNYPFDHWEYKEPISTDYRDDESYWFDLLEQTDTQTLINLGNLLNRYLNHLKYNGHEI